MVNHSGFPRYQSDPFGKSSTAHPHNKEWPLSCKRQLVIRYYLNKENRRRDALQAEVGEAERFFDENGNEIDTTFLDITDVSRSAS